MAHRRVLLIVSGGIAAYKSLELIRRLREHELDVRCVVTRGGAQFVTPLSLAALSENKVYSDLFSLIDEAEMGHITLSRQADLILVAPASADLLAKMANGLADDLATTLLLATDAPVMVAPAMNVRMWDHPATRANLATLQQRGITIVGPDTGPMACGEFGPGRMSDPEAILSAVLSALEMVPEPKQSALAGRSVLVTSGPTHEAIDPVRYIANRSSGKQGHAIARSLARRGAAVTLVSGPTGLPMPDGVKTIAVESARDMLQACQDSLPVDVAVFAAAVADWRVDNRAGEKLKKHREAGAPTLSLVENPDILRTIATAGERRPPLVIGFAAETGSLVERAVEKRRRKGCDWILANDVSEGSETFGGTLNQIHFIDAESRVEPWPTLSKDAVAERLADRIERHFATVTEEPEE